MVFSGSYHRHSAPPGSLSVAGLCKGKGIQFIVLYPPKCSHICMHTFILIFPAGETEERDDDDDEDEPSQGHDH